MGHILGPQGISADPVEIASIPYMVPPPGFNKIRRLLGMIYQLGKLTPMLAEYYKPTRDLHITKTRLFKYIENFTTKEKENFQIKNSDIFHYPAQNIDCGYSLEPPSRGDSNEYPQSMFLSRNKKNNVNPSYTI